jgi:DoxX-like family
LRIDGVGENTGTRADASGSRTSALSFWSNDSKSLISKGSGYWNYVPTEASVRFLTWYDYETRFGRAGRIIDRVVFRPVIGWATAWSFDRLRLWIERGISPETSLRMAVIHASARVCIAFIWAWQGLLPKLLLPSGDEKPILSTAGASIHLLPAIGVAEVVFGIIGIALWRSRGFFVLNGLMMIAALVEIALRSFLSVCSIQSRYAELRGYRLVMRGISLREGTAISRPPLPPTAPVSKRI